MNPIIFRGDYPIPQLHIYDRDVSKYKKIVSKINLNANHKAFQTEFYEIENYIHPVLYEHCYNVTTPFIDISNDQWKDGWQDLDIPKKLNGYLVSCYEQGDTFLKDYGVQGIKKKLSLELSKRITVEHLSDLNAYEEVNNWFKHIKKSLELV